MCSLSGMLGPWICECVCVYVRECVLFVPEFLWVLERVCMCECMCVCVCAERACVSACMHACMCEYMCA